MEKQVYAFRLGDAAVSCERQRIDAMEREVITAPDQGFKFRDDARAPRSSLLDASHLALEEPFLNERHGGPT